MTDNNQDLKNNKQYLTISATTSNEPAIICRKFGNFEFCTTLRFHQHFKTKRQLQLEPREQQDIMTSQYDGDRLGLQQNVNTDR